MKEIFLTWGMLVLSVIFNVYGVFVIKLKLNEFGAIKCDSFQTVLSYFWLLIKSPLIISGLVLFTIAPAFFIISLSRMEISVAYPAQLGLNFLILLLLAVIFLGEQMTLYKIIGIILIFVAIYFLNNGKFY